MVLPLVGLETALPLTKPAAYSTEAQLSMWEREVNFYSRMLTWWSLNCHAADQDDVDSLVAQMETLRVGDLPALRDTAASALRATSGPMYKDWQGFSELRERLNCFEVRLDNLKAKIFDGFQRIGHVQIW